MIAAMLRTRPNPSIAPFDAASTTFAELSLIISTSFWTLSCSVSGQRIFAIIRPAGAAINAAEIKYSIGIPSIEYPTNIEPETDANPPTITANNSDSVSFET